MPIMRLLRDPAGKFLAKLAEDQSSVTREQMIIIGRESKLL